MAGNFEQGELSQTHNQRNTFTVGYQVIEVMTYSYNLFLWYFMMLHDARAMATAMIRAMARSVAKARARIKATVNAKIRTLVRFIDIAMAIHGSIYRFNYG